MLQIKLSIKTPFDYRHLTSSSFYLYLPLKLSEETTQRKHAHTLQPILANNNKLSLATNKPTSPAKIILQYEQRKQKKIHANDNIKQIFFSN